MLRVYRNVQGLLDYSEHALDNGENAEAVALDKALCAMELGQFDPAATEFGEFDLDFNSDEPPVIIYYAYIETGLCLKEMGKPDEAMSSIDLAIKLREWYGEKVKGVWPIPVAARGLVLNATRNLDALARLLGHRFGPAQL
jgi:tetratricopeptide (TPR) repeat protein